MTHTAVPWTIERGAELGQALIVGADGVLVADLEAANWARKFEGTITGDNAAFIVRAANCHDELLAALKIARAFVQAELDVRIDSHTLGGDMATLDESEGGICGEAMDCLARIDAAIAKAEPPQ